MKNNIKPGWHSLKWKFLVIHNPLDLLKMIFYVKAIDLSMLLFCDWKIKPQIATPLSLELQQAMGIPDISISLTLEVINERARDTWLI